MPERALTLKQPWAWLVVHGAKMIENRAWNTQFRGRFYVHASKFDRRSEYDRAVRVCAALGHYLPPFRADCYQFGGIIGEATIVDVLPKESVRPWKFQGQYGFILDERRPITKFVPCRGALNFWWIPEDVESQMIYAPVASIG